MDNELEQFIGRRNENGTQYPVVNLAGAVYALPPNTIGLGKGIFAVLSGLPVDKEMIETLRGYLNSGSSNEAASTASDEPKADKRTRGVQPSSNVPSGGDDPSDPK